MAILPEFWQNCQNSGRNVSSSSYLDGFHSIAAILPERIIPAILQETNLHTKSSIAAILPEYYNIAMIDFGNGCPLDKAIYQISKA